MTDLKQSTEPFGSSLEVEPILLIDGDSIPWMIGWHHREHQDSDIVVEAVDRWMTELLLQLGNPRYAGFLAHITGTCFRYHTYKVAPYKGNRPPKPDWFTYWLPIIRRRLAEHWGFSLSRENLETDDMIACLSHHLYCNPRLGLQPYVYSRDKDLRQIPGIFLEYQKQNDESEGLGVLQEFRITSEQATWNLQSQLLTGDGTDNILGLPGIGPAKAEKLLKETELYVRPVAIKRQYQKFFGPFYGDIIFAETEAAVRMMTPEHPLWGTYGFEPSDYLDGETIRKYDTQIHSGVE